MERSSAHLQRPLCDHTLTSQIQATASAETSPCQGRLLSLPPLQKKSSGSALAQTITCARAGDAMHAHRWGPPEGCLFREQQCLQVRLQALLRHAALPE